MKNVKQIWLFLLVVVFAGNSSIAQESLSRTDRENLKGVIEAQLSAFRSHDGELAFSYATPGIQAQFGNAEYFMQMVRRGYEPVYQNSAVVFKETIESDEMIAQEVLILDTDGNSVMAIYPMERQPDGLWRIAGCYLVQSEETIL